MKNVNLMVSRLPLPAEGPALDFGDIGADERREEEAEVLEERKGPPFFVRGSILLTFLIAGVVLVAWGAYYALIRPLDFSGKPTPVAAKTAAVRPEKRVAPAPAAPLPRVARMNGSSPPARPVSPVATRTLGGPGAPPPPAKGPSPRIPAAALAMTETGGKGQETSLAGPKPGETRKETPEPTARASVAPGPTPKPGEPAPPSPPGEAGTPRSKPVGESPPPGKAGAPKPKTVGESPPKVEPPPGAAKPGKPAEMRLKAALKAPKDKSPKAKARMTETAGAAKGPAGAVRKGRAPSGPGRVAAARAGRYSIQVGACRTSKCVERLSRRLRKSGLEPMTAKSRNRRLTLVLTGAYPTWAAARAELKNVITKGFKGSYAIKR